VEIRTCHTEFPTRKFLGSGIRYGMGEECFTETKRLVFIEEIKHIRLMLNSQTLKLSHKYSTSWRFSHFIRLTSLFQTNMLFDETTNRL